ncbi:MAG: hypothetical protein ACYCWE_02375 [Eubacteriales bacterium]
MTGRKFYLTITAVLAVTAAVIFSVVLAAFNPNIGSRLVRGRRFLAHGDGAAAAAEFSAVLERFDFGDPAEIGNDPEKYTPAYYAALGYADAKALTGEPGEAEVFLRLFSSYSAEAASRLEALAAETQSAPEITEPENDIIVWQNKVLENIIREALSLPDGDIYSSDLHTVYDICILGSRYTAINMLSRGAISEFTSLLDLYESERGLYEGYQLTDLSDLNHFKDLTYVLLYDCSAVLPEDLSVKIAVTGR